MSELTGGGGSLLAGRSIRRGWICGIGRRRALGGGWGEFVRGNTI